MKDQAQMLRDQLRWWKAMATGTALVFMSHKGCEVARAQLVSAKLLTVEASEDGRAELYVDSKGGLYVWDFELKVYRKVWQMSPGFVRGWSRLPDAGTK